MFVLLYLYTPSVEEFYLRLGWITRERTSYRGASVAVMSIETQDKPQMAADEEASPLPRKSASSALKPPACRSACANFPSRASFST